MSYPEHEKLTKVRDKSQTIGEFLDWLLNETEFHIAVFDNDDYLIHTNLKIEDYLARYFSIDQDKIEEEKRAMLEAQRELNDARA